MLSLIDQYAGKVRELAHCCDPTTSPPLPPGYLTRLALRGGSGGISRCFCRGTCEPTQGSKSEQKIRKSLANYY